MEFIKAICEKNECYLVGDTIKPKGIVVHSTGANNPNLSRYCDNVVELGENKYSNHWNQFRPDGRQVCVHAFIGLDKNKNVRTAQTLPWNRRCWGCGKGSKGTYNDSHIQFEICEDGLTDSTYFNKIYNEAVQLCVYLCKEYNIEPNNIVCHKEAYRAGYGSNHTDVEHWFPKFGKTMDDFREEVNKLLGVEEEKPIDNKELFIERIAEAVKKIAPEFGIKVYSPIIAQACLESAYGTSELAVNVHNYFGLKWRENRVPSAIGIYNKVGSEQNADGSYVSSAMQWCKFNNLEDCVRGYFEFINISRYNNLKGVTEPKTYLQLIKDDGYATSLKYVDNVYNVIVKNNLQRFDNVEIEKEEVKTNTISACPFKVKVSIPDLNIRTGAGTNYSKIGRYTGVGVFTIIEVRQGAGSKKGWGLLKSKLGWISLDYCTVV